jgi:hypothetical protein
VTLDGRVVLVVVLVGLGIRALNGRRKRASVRAAIDAGRPVELNPPQNARASEAAARGWTYEPVAKVVPCITPRGTMRFTAEGLDVVRGSLNGVAFEAFEFAEWSFARTTLTSLVTQGDLGSQLPGLVTVTLPVELPARLTIIRRHDGRTTRVDGPLADGFDFESGDFNARYIVWSDLDRKLTEDVVSPLAIEWLMWAPEDFALLMWGRTALAPLPRGASADTVATYASVLTAVVAAVPAFVWSDLAGTADRDAAAGS